MKIINCIKYLMLLAAISILATSCSSDDDGGPVIDPTPTSTSKYVVGFQALPVGDASPVDYILELPSLASLTTGEISVEGQGTPLKGWRFFHNVKNTVFTAGYSDDDKCIAYGLDKDGKLIEKGNFAFQSTLDNYSAIDDKTLLAVELTYSGLSDKRFHIINAETGKLEKIVEHPIDIDKGDGTAKNPGTIPWVTGMVLRDGKLFVSYHKWMADGSYVTPDVNRAYVAVFKYPEFELEKIIYDDRTSPIGVNGHSTGIEKTENGDIYSFSTSALSAGFTSATKPSGILRIKNGATEFDKSYFFDVESAPNGGKLFWMDYVGDGKAIARIIIDDTVGPWGVFKETGDFFKLVIIDLENKTVTDVQGMPTHANRYTSPMYVEDGKAYLSSYAGTETHVYIVDPKTATATKGAKVQGLALKGIFKVTN
ncbi:hypothetical protein IWQ47_001717 [Aquimarina sp. EL_43]|uniref:DUF4374 domain-containing protein n=1 Tax=Aquimarina TaxID=290174 RepID=UPI000551AF08|nr:MULTISPECIES: DUF4374 domain-containing protein [Aquimarina]MBG6130200.1 hypothetical protein [Aquimarina sp. EL_35]MBG6148980.1 hypothetical protein [Aquimarina sp. EL_32]MBG6168646.1 hypothetical protein [Aquimarina sp. EL_43]